MVYGWMMWFGLAALAGGFVHAWRVVNLRTAGAVKKIAIDRHARASVFCGGGRQGAVLDGATMLTPYALFYSGTPMAKRYGNA